LVGRDAASVNIWKYRVKSPLLLATVGTCCVVIVSVPVCSPWIVWNASSSVPIGLYRVQPMTPGRHDLALIRLAPDLATLANRRGYLHGTDYVLKPVVANAGDTVCRLGAAILVRGDIAALAQRRDRANRPMPIWQGCHTLKPGELFLLSALPDSFDSRYFGRVAATQVIGSAQPLWLFPDITN